MACAWLDGGLGWLRDARRYGQRIVQNMDSLGETSCPCAEIPAEAGFAILNFLPEILGMISRHEKAGPSAPDVFPVAISRPPRRRNYLLTPDKPGNTLIS